MKTFEAASSIYASDPPVQRNTAGFSGGGRLARTGMSVYTMCIRAGGTTVTKTLIKHGNSLALVIDKPILEMLQISADTPLELSTDGDSILISPVRDKARQQKLRASLRKINKKFGDDLRRLAE
jgi:antitoxin MazE